MSTEPAAAHLNRNYIEASALHAEQMGRSYAWLDTGTHDSLLEVGEFVHTIHRQGWINADAARTAGERFRKTAYGRAIIAAVDCGNPA